ncbi:MAG: hypothetical protein WDN26_20355, partial [Chitinophagaceae bacterium]
VLLAVCISYQKLSLLNVQKNHSTESNKKDGQDGEYLHLFDKKKFLFLLFCLFKTQLKISFFSPVKFGKFDKSR